MKKEIIIKECYHSCPFFKTTMDGMECGHEYFDGKGYESMIITQNNSKGRVPNECPLKEENLIIEYKLKYDSKLIYISLYNEDHFDGLICEEKYLSIFQELSKLNNYIDEIFYTEREFLNHQAEMNLYAKDSPIVSTKRTAKELKNYFIARFNIEYFPDNIKVLINNL